MYWNKMVSKPLKIQSCKRFLCHRIKIHPSIPRIRKGVVSQELLVPPEILRPPYVTDYTNWIKQNKRFFDENNDLISQNEIVILDDEERLKLRAACKLAKNILAYAGTLVKPGITTDEIDRLVHLAIVSENAYPSPLNYRTSDETGCFPKSICTSINEVMCHGIPDSTVLKTGDIITVDVTVFLDGFHGDTAKTFFVGKSTNPTIEKLVSVNREAVLKAISVCGPGESFKAIGSTVESHARKNGFRVVPEFFGHGIGRQFHQYPFVAHVKNPVAGIMKEGMAFTIEPLMTQGKEENFLWEDRWTVASSDGAWSAQKEHTILITKDGAEALTF